MTGWPLTVRGHTSGREQLLSRQPDDGEHMQRIPARQVISIHALAPLLIPPPDTPNAVRAAFCTHFGSPSASTSSICSPPKQWKSRCCAACSAVLKVPVIKLRLVCVEV